jgi:hypothetical protein
MSKPLKSGLAAFALALLGFTALAAAPAFAGWSQTFEIGPDIYYYHYTEPHFAHLDGFMYGATGAFSINYDQLSLRFEGRGATGSLKYDGSGTSSGNDNYTAEARIILKREFDIDETWGVSPYFGIGFRYLFDAQGGIATSTGALGYDRESHYYYVPVGFDLPVNIAPDWRMVPNVEYDFLFVGKQTSYLTNVPGISNDITNTQTGGHAFRASLMLEGKTPIGEVRFGPYIRYWSIGTSNTQPLSINGVALYGQEPGNHTVEAGGSLVYIFQ